MKRLIVALFVVCMFSQVSLWAADEPKAEVFGGFSALTLNPTAGTRVTPLGWQGSVAGSVNNMVSLVADFGGQYKNSTHAYEYLGGVQVSSRADKMSFFGHALFGAATGGSSTAANTTGFMMGYGGGIDLKAGDKVAVRAIQFDWLPSKDNGAWETNQLRFGFGLVFLSK